MSNATPSTSTTTKSNAGGAGGLFSCFDFYSRFEGLSEVHTRMVGAGGTLHKAVISALRETVVGSNSDSRDTLLADVITEPSLSASVFTHIPPNSMKDAQKDLAGFVERLIDSKVAEVGCSIDEKLRTEVNVGLEQFSDVMDSESITYQKLSDQILSDKKLRIASGGMTAKGKLEGLRLAAQASFTNEGEKLQPFLVARLKVLEAIEKTQTAGIQDLGNSSVDIDTWLANDGNEEKEKRLKSKLQDIDRAIYSVYISNLGSFDNRKENKPTDVLVPSHLEKGKGEELGNNSMNWTKNRLDKFFVIHRYVKRVVMDRGEGTFWEPPKKSNDFAGVPEYEKEEYIKQTKALYDDLANKAHKDVWSLLTQPEPAGFYGLQGVCGEVDDGVLALYVLLMRYYPNNNNYCQKLKTFLNNTPLLVQSPRVDVRSVCKEIGPPLKEAIKLGVRVPWDTSGLAFIETLCEAKPAFMPYLHPLKHSVPDREDSAPQFQMMLSRIESALNDSKSKPHTQRSRELLAYEMSFEANPYSVQYVEGGGDEGWEVVDTSATAEYNAYDTSYNNPDFSETAEQEMQYYDCGEVPEGEGGCR